MKFRLPEGCAALSHAGEQLAVAADGTVEVDPAAAADLAPHGLAPVADKPAGADQNGGNGTGKEADTGADQRAEPAKSGRRAR